MATGKLPAFVNPPLCCHHGFGERMPQQFDKLGIRFAYPDNWALEEEEVAGGQAVSVSSPGGAFWWVAIFEQRKPAAEIARAVIEGLRQQYNNIDVEAVVGDVIAGQEMLGYDANFYCLDLLSTACVRGFETPQCTYMMLWQAEDREFEQVAPIFEAITTSLVRTASQNGRQPNAPYVNLTFNPISSFICSSASALPRASSTGWCVWRVWRRCLNVANVSPTMPL